MKRDESRELTSARKLLSEFEREMSQPSAKTKLTEALSLISDIVEEAGPESQVGENLAQVYASKTAASVTAILNEPGEISLAVLTQWEELLTEFGRSGIESASLVAAKASLSKRLASRYVAQLTQAEKELLLRRLEEEVKKERT